MQKNKTLPITFTLFGALLGLTTCALLAMHMPILALIALFASGGCDILDGYLARRHSIASPIGAVLDITADRFVEFAVILGLVLYDPTRAFAALLMLGSILLCVTTFLVVGIFIEKDSKKSFHYSPGLIERPEAFGFFALQILFPSLFTSLALLFACLVLLTAMIRILQFVNINKLPTDVP